MYCIFYYKAQKTTDCMMNFVWLFTDKFIQVQELPVVQVYLIWKTQSQKKLIHLIHLKFKAFIVMEFELPSHV